MDATKSQSDKRILQMSLITISQMEVPFPLEVIVTNKRPGIALIAMRKLVTVNFSS